MKIRDAILLTTGLFVLGLLVRFQIAGTAVPLLTFVIFGTSLWAALDWAKLRLHISTQRIAYGPVVLFFGLLIIWVIAFPWYLSVRHKIQPGSARRLTTGTT